MSVHRTELLSVDEIAALLGKSIEETIYILEKWQIPIAGVENEEKLYAPEIITKFVIQNPDVMF